MISFDFIAEVYDKYRHAHSFLADHIIDLCKEQTNSCRIIELGCGTGNYLEYLSKSLNTKIYGVDNSTSMLTQAIKKFNIELIESDCNKKLPFKNGSFDIAFSVNFIHFIINLKDYFREVYRILDNNGITYTATHSEGDFRQQVLGQYFPETVEIEIANTPAIDNIISSIEQVGFSNIITENIKGCLPLDENFLQACKSKTFSCLHSIDEKSFIRGINRLENDIRAINVDQGVLSYTIIKGIK